MSAFNAGSIEANLTIDTRPFSTGLMKAREEARRFESEKIVKNIKVDVNTAEANAKIDAEKTKLDVLDAKKVQPKVDVDTGLATAKLLAFKALMNKALDAGGAGKHLTGPALSMIKPLAIAGGLMAVTAAAAPAAVAMTTFGAAAGVALAGAGVAIGIFAKVASSDFADLQKATKAGLHLKGPAGEAQKALKGLSGAMDELKKKTAGNVFGLMTKSFNVLGSILPRLAPLTNTVAKGLTGVVSALGGLTKTPLFAQFLTSLQKFMGGFLKGLAPVLVTILSTFMRLFTALQPVFSALGKSITNMTNKFSNFSKSLQTGGIQKLMGYIHQFAPMLTKLLGDTFSALKNIIVGIAPLGMPALRFIDGLVKAVGKVNLKPFAKGFGDMLDALNPILPVLAQIVNTLLPPLGRLMSSLATSVIKPLASSLGSELSPALDGLAKFLDAAVGPLSAFLGSIANLVNPTGISLLSTLLTSVLSAITPLLGPVSELAVAFESMIDNALQVIIPMLPTLANGLKDVVNAITPLISGLAGILAMKRVGPILLGLAAAVYVGVKAFKAYRAIMAVVTLLQGAYATAMLGSVAANTAGGLSLVLYRVKLVATKVAQLAVTAATKAWGLAVVIGNLAKAGAAHVLYAARMVATKVAQLAVSAATKAFAAAQWLLNAAMSANPIGLVVLAIAALVAGLIIAYKRSETFRNIVNGALRAVGAMATWLWNNAFQPALKMIVKGFGWVLVGIGKMISALGRIPGFGWAKVAGQKMQDAGYKALGMADSIRKIPAGVNVRASQTGFQYVIDMANKMNAAVRKAGGNVHYATGSGGGLTQYAKGTTDYPGGWAVAGEDGAELVNYPKHTKIFSNAKSKKMMQDAGQSAGGLTSGSDNNDSSTRTNALLAAILYHLSAANNGGGFDQEAMIDALIKAYSRANVESAKKILQLSRSK